MDYSIWGLLKQRLWRCRVKDTAGLKRALKRVWKELSQQEIDKALEEWPKRVFKIYKAKGHHIEHK